MLKKILATLQSKRVIVAVVTAAILAVNQELGFTDPDTLTKITAVVVALILGDSLRATVPDKDVATDAAG